MMSAETQEGSVAVLWNYFCFTHWLLILKSLVFYLQTHRDPPCISCTCRPKDIQTGRKASHSAPHSPTPLLLPHQLRSLHSPSYPSLRNAEPRQVNIPWKSCKADHFKRLPRAAKEKLTPQTTYQGFSKPIYDTAQEEDEGRTLILWG